MLKIDKNNLKFVKGGVVNRIMLPPGMHELPQDGLPPLPSGAKPPFDAPPFGGPPPAGLPPIPGFPPPSDEEMPEELKMLSPTIDIPDHYVYERLIYVENPIDVSRQIMNVYIPAAYIDGGENGKYSAATAPILFYVEGGGFKIHTLPQIDQGLSADYISAAVKRGFVVAAANFRGADDFRVAENGEKVYTGQSPAQAVDLKAALRFLRANADVLPGDTEKIVVAGVSSGGAMTQLLGASGNTHRFDAELKALGACDGRDDVKAAAPFCGPGDLARADMEYDWIFGRNTYEYKIKHNSRLMGEYDQPIAVLSGGFPKLLPNYSSGETDYDYYSVYAKQYVDTFIKGTLGISEAEYIAIIMKHLLPSYEKYRAERPGDCGGHYFYFDNYDEYLKLGFGPDPYRETSRTASGNYFNFNLFRAYSSEQAFKGSPAFDALTVSDMRTSENVLFGDSAEPIRNFTDYAFEHSKFRANDNERVKSLVANQTPASYIETGDSEPCKHWLITHGTRDGDIPFIMSLNLYNLLKAKGINDSTFRLKFGVGHNCDISDEQAFFDWCESVLN